MHSLTISSISKSIFSITFDPIVSPLITSFRIFYIFVWSFLLSCYHIFVNSFFIFYKFNYSISFIFEMYSPILFCINTQLSTIASFFFADATLISFENHFFPNHAFGILNIFSKKRGREGERKRKREREKEREFPSFAFTQLNCRDC